VRLTDGDSGEKEASFHLATNRFHFSQPDFKRVAGSPMVYWVGLRLVELYEKLPPVGNLALFREGLHTADNGRFVRQWWEVEAGRFGRNETGYESMKTSGARWIPYNKGGGCIRWYGNYEYVVAFDEDSRNAMAELKGHIRPSQSLYFKQGGTWSDIGSKGFGVKYYPSGFLFDAKGPVCVGANIEVLIAGLNSAPFAYLAELLMPTISYKCGTVKTIPFPTGVDSAQVETTSNTAITLARDDWDNFESSWDFRDHPLLRPGLKDASLAASWRSWEAHCVAAIRRMQELETQNNLLFIAAYGLDGELQPEMPEDQITLAHADAKKDMSAFLSYAVGCMMGRYSLDAPGLILADAGDTVKEYLAKVNRPLDKLTYTPDEDGIIPVLDGEWFEDDIVARTRDFLRATFGEATLRENLRFIEDSLGKDLRKYFLNDFYKDHLQTYKKRPIYWLVQSPKKGFSVLIYLHRYTKDTMNLVLNRYLRDYQAKLRNRLTRVTELQVTAATAREKTDARREAEKLTKILAECDEWERQTMLPLAQARIELDLDDGVKTNYLKLGEALAPIAGLAAKEEE
jgi:thiol-disulfide isomerase/thioredoxin